MFDFSELSKSEDLINKKIEEKKSQAENIYKSALKKLDSFKENRNEDDLKKSAKLFFEVIKIDKKKIEAYIWLSYIFYITDKDKLSIKYLKLAEEIDKNHAKLKELKSLITKSNYSVENEREHNNSKIESFYYNFYELENETWLKKLKILFNLYKDKIHFNVKVKNEKIILFKQGEHYE